MQVLEPAVPGTVTGDVRRLLAADRLGRRAPQLAAVVVPDVDRLAHRVADGVVGPRRELVLAAVPRPRVARPGLGDLEPERRVGDHVQPRRRGGLPGAEDRDVLAPVVGEATEPVEELQLRARRGRLAPTPSSTGPARRVGRSARDARGGSPDRRGCPGGSAARPGRRSGAACGPRAESWSPRRM